MKRFFLLAACAAATCAPVFGQTTWNNLKFGEAPDDIAASLAAQGMTLEREAKSGGFRVKPDWKWTPETDAHQLVFRVAIAGTATGGLQKVALLLDSTALHARIPELPVVVDYSVTPVRKYLMDKYGTPASEKGTCNLSGQDLVNELINQDTATCEETWNSGGQIVTVHWSYYAQKNNFNYLLMYAPAGPVVPLPPATPAAPQQ